MEMKLVPLLPLIVKLVRQDCITQRTVNQMFQLVFPVRQERILQLLEHHLNPHVKIVQQGRMLTKLEHLCVNFVEPVNQVPRPLLTVRLRAFLVLKAGTATNKDKHIVRDVMLESITKKLVHQYLLNATSAKLVIIKIL